MDKAIFQSLRVGDIVKGKLSGGNAYIVTGNYGDHIIAVQTVHMTQPDEWELIRRAGE